MKELSLFQTAYLDSHQIKPLIADYANPDDLLSRWVKSGVLIRLKKGFYLIKEKIEKQAVPYEQIANLLYGPSYVSYEWALSYYGFIPEGVYVVTCATPKKARRFKTPIGLFDYTFQNIDRYSIGITQGENSAGRFLIATPEKALADLVYQKSRHLNINELTKDLLEGRRIDEHSLRSLNGALLKEIAAQYHTKSVANLVKLYDKLQS